MKNNIALYLKFIPFFLWFFIWLPFAQTQDWQHLPGPNGAAVRHFSTDGNGNLFLTSDIAVYRSLDNGQNWSRLSLPSMINHVDEFSVLCNNHYIVKEYDQSYLSTDGSKNWLRIDPWFLSNFLLDSTGLTYAGSFSNGIWVSKDTAMNWNQLALPGTKIKQVLIPNQGCFLCFSDSVILRSFDYGLTWDQHSLPGIEPHKVVMDSSGSIYVLYKSSINGIFRSDNLGISWTSIISNLYISDIAVTGKQEIGISTSRGVFITPDQGESWINIGFEDNWFMAIGTDFIGNILTGSLQDAFRYSRLTGEWQEINYGLNSLRIWAIGFGKDNTVIASGSNKLFRSPDGGNSWFTVYNTPNDEELRGAIVTNASGLMFTTVYDNLLKSVDDGLTWNETSLNTNGKWISSIASASVGNLIVATDRFKVYTSSDNGNNWSIAFESPSKIMTVVVDNDGRIYAQSDSIIYRSTTNAKEWEKFNVPKIQINYMPPPICIDMRGWLYAASLDGVIRSTNYGESWHQFEYGISSSNPGIFSIDNNGNVILRGAGTTVYRLSNSIDGWEELFTKVSHWGTVITTLGISPEGYVFAGTQDDGLYKTILPLPDRTPNILNSIKLSQNFPNPFNSSTTIIFAVSQPTHVELSIYNILGQKIAVLISDICSPNNHATTWVPGSISNGIYIAKLKSDVFEETIKILLLR